MGWFPSIAIGLITAVLGGVGAGLIAGYCVRWYRISSFEGASGYFIAFVTLLGLVLGLAIGIVCARIVASWPQPGFLKGLGVGAGSTVGLALVVGLVCRLAADVPPTLDGKSLELALEIRCPADFVLPAAAEPYGAFASVHLVRGRHQPQGELRLKEAKQIEGRWIVTATVPLATSSGDKHLRAYFNRDYDLLFWLPLARHPSRQDLAWSRWIESGWDAGKPEPPKEKKFNLRYRVQPIAPAPEPVETDPAPEDEEARFFAGLPPDAPLEAWLRFARYDTPAERRLIAITRMTERTTLVPELGQLMQSPNAEQAADALRVVEYLPAPTPDLNEPVAEVGRQIAAAIRLGNTITPEQDESYLWAAAISIRFHGWMSAVRTLRTKCGGDFTPELRAILELARVRRDSHVMQQDVVRVASYHLHEWIGLEPLPTDPKPR